MNPSLRKHLKDTILVASKTSADDYGKPVYGSDVEYKGRVVKKLRMILSSTGDQRMSETQVILDATSVQPDDRITLPDGRKPRIIAIETYAEFGGHQVVLL